MSSLPSLRGKASDGCTEVLPSISNRERPRALQSMASWLTRHGGGEASWLRREGAAVVTALALVVEIPAQAEPASRRIRFDCVALRGPVPITDRSDLEEIGETR